MQMVALLGLSCCNQPNLNHSIGPFVSDAADILNFKCLNHPMHFSCIRGLLAYVAMAIRR